jgi:transcriptional regulator
MSDEDLLAFLEALSDRHEARITAGDFWKMDKVPPTKLKTLLAGIVGFEMEVQAWRPTFKLSQNTPADERERVASGLEAQGSMAIAQLVRSFGA